ncbi:MAG TPA: hypothetical protein DIT67_09165 [Octadecabacter sp.]|nr:hypothetical protein [Octadecabacter sp.]
MRQATIDLMIEFAVASLATEDHRRIRKLVRELAHVWPNEPALSIAFAITSAASTIEDMVDTPDSTKSAQLAFRLAALVAADIYAVQEMGQVPAKGQDLMHFWRRVDPYFLDV